jgi:hypothetical protein
MDYTDYMDGMDGWEWHIGGASPWCLRGPTPAGRRLQTVEPMRTSEGSSILLLLAPQSEARRVGKRVSVVSSIRFADCLHRPANFFHASGMLPVRATVSWPSYPTEAWPMSLTINPAIEYPR